MSDVSDQREWASHELVGARNDAISYFFDGIYRINMNLYNYKKEKLEPRINTNGHERKWISDFRSQR